MDPAELEDLGWGIHQGEPDLPLSGPHLARAVIRPKLLHLVEGGGGEVFNDEEVEVVRTGTPRGGEGLPLEEEDRCPVGLVGESEDEGGWVRDPPFIFGIAVDAEALLNGSLQLRDHLKVALSLGHSEDGFQDLVIRVLDGCFVAVLG